MDVTDWRLFLQPYEQAVEELKVKFKTMRKELKMREAYAPIEFVTGRVKKISSIIEKAYRLKVSMSNIDKEIEDIAGIRIMCQFIDDVHRVADFIRSRKDMRVVNEKDYITNFKQSGYRSFHLIVEYEVQTALEARKVLAEIQIRTLAMNFWATIEHSLNYKYKERIPGEVKERLRIASEAAFVLDNEMSHIRQIIIDSQRDFEQKSNVVNEILSGIQDLYFYHRVRDAIQYQLYFNEAWMQEDAFKMQQLSEEIKSIITELKSSHKE